MASYRFRAYYEDDDSIYRDVRVASVHGFKQLEEILNRAFELPVGKYTVKFYKSNDSWQKVGKFKTEITREVTSGKKKTTEVTPVLLQQIVDDPHIRMIALFKSEKDEFILQLEMMQIFIKDDPKVELPLVVSSQGPSPFKEDEVKKYLTAKTIDKIEEQYAYAEEDEGDDEEGGKKGRSSDDEDEDSDEESTDEEGGATPDYGDNYDVF